MTSCQDETVITKPDSNKRKHPVSPQVGHAHCTYPLLAPAKIAGRPHCARHLWVPIPSHPPPAPQDSGKGSTPARLLGHYDANEARRSREKTHFMSLSGGSPEGFQAAGQALLRAKLARAGGKKRPVSPPLRREAPAFVMPTKKLTTNPFATGQATQLSRSTPVYAKGFWGVGVDPAKGVKGQDWRPHDTPIKGAKHSSDRRDQPFSIEGAFTFLTGPFARPNIGGVEATHEEK